MSTPEQEEKAQRAHASTQHSRMLAYIVAGCVFAAGVYTGYYDSRLILIIPLTVLIPWGQRFLADRLQDRYPSQANATLMLTDGLAVGLGIAAAGLFGFFHYITVGPNRPDDEDHEENRK